MSIVATTTTMPIATHEIFTGGGGGGIGLSIWSQNVAKAEGRGINQKMASRVAAALKTIRTTSSNANAEYDVAPIPTGASCSIISSSPAHKLY